MTTGAMEGCNTNFIAHARENIPKLVAYIKKLREQVVIADNLAQKFCEQLERLDDELTN